MNTPVDIPDPHKQGSKKIAQEKSVAGKAVSGKTAPEKALGKASEKSSGLSLSNPADWEKIQSGWTRRLETAQAHADKYFMTDDELPLRHHLLLVIIAFFVFIFIVWANFASLDEVTKGQGKVIPSSEVQVVSSLSGGIIDKFFVKEGDPVTAGEVLVQMHDIQAASDLGSNRQKYLGLKAKSQRLEAEIEGLPSPKFTQDVVKGVPATVQQEMQAFRSDEQNLQSQTAVLEQELSQRRGEENEAQTKIIDLRGVVSLAKQQRDMTAPLVKRGSAPKMELLQLDQQIQQHMTELNGYSSSLPRIRAAIDEAQARIRELTNSTKAQAQTDMTATTAEMSTLAPTLTALEDRKTQSELKSPVNGTVKDMKITTVGGVAQPGQTVLEIVPKDDQLVIQANVRPADIAFLYPGETAVVKLTAYDYAIYGSLRGKVVDISADTITNEKGESFYRVRIRTNQNHLVHDGEILNIIPGMVASVDITTGKKTVMEYLLKPFIKTLRSSLHER